jgi:hypothetical protein
VAQHFVKALLNRAELLAINPTQLPRAGLLASFELGHIYESRVSRQLARPQNGPGSIKKIGKLKPNWTMNAAICADAPCQRGCEARSRHFPFYSSSAVLSVLAQAHLLNLVSSIQLKRSRGNSDVE